MVLMNKQFFAPIFNWRLSDYIMFASHTIGKLAIGSLFSTAGEFGFSVRRFNEDSGKLLKLYDRSVFF